MRRSARTAPAREQVDLVLRAAGIRFASVATRTLSGSDRAIIDALIADRPDPRAARARQRSMNPEHHLVGYVGDHHALLRLHLALIDHLDALIAVIDDRIETRRASFTAECKREVPTITGESAALGRRTQ